jgi:hypothetical protein
MQIERHSELAAGAGEVFFEFAAALAKLGVGLLPIAVSACRLQASFVVVEGNLGYSALGSDEENVSDRRMVGGKVHGKNLITALRRNWTFSDVDHDKQKARCVNTGLLVRTSLVRINEA